MGNAEMNDELLDAALQHAANGLPVFPCHPENKTPLVKRGFKDASRDEQTIRGWWQKHPDAMIGVPTGEATKFWVLDVDDPEAFETSVVPIPETRRSDTGKGYHLYFKYDPARPVRNAQCKVDKATGDKIWPFKTLPGAEVRGEGGYVIVPPSRHPSGAVYRWHGTEGTSEPSERLMRVVLKPAETPASGQRAVAPPANDADTAYGIAALDDECEAIRCAPDGTQEKTLNDAALKIGALVAGGTLTAHTAKGSLIAAALSMPSYNSRDPWTAEKVVAKVERGMTDGAANPRGPEERTISRSHAIVGAGGEEAREPVNDDDVHEPVDLWARYEAPFIPRGLLPKIIEDYAFSHGDVMGVDPAGLAMSALTVCAAAITDSIQVQVKRYDPTWTESARLWTGLVGPPSRKKSPIMRSAIRPLKRIDATLMQAYMLKKQQYDDLPAKDRKSADRPIQERRIIADATVEAAQEVMKDSPRGVLSAQDELSAWFGSMDKYAPGKSGMADRGFWLQAFNGGSYSLNRIGRGSSYIRNCSICVLGGIQPEPLRAIAGDTHDDGLIQRFLPIILRAPTEGKDMPIGDTVRDYENLVGKLNLMEAPTKPIAAGDVTARVKRLKFSDGARSIREALAREHLDLVSALEGSSPKLSAHFGKYDGLFARLCVLWHCIETEQGTIVAEEISERTAKRVAEFMEFYLRRNAIAFYAGLLGFHDGFDLIQGLAAYIVSEGLSEVNARVVQRSTRALKAFTADECRALCEKLEGFGWLDPLQPKARSNTPRWRVNPAVHDLYAERGRKETERREASRAALRKALGV